VLTGFCYTQFADTYQEANGLLFADRTPKFPIDRIAAATSGRTVSVEEEPDATENRELETDNREPGTRERPKLKG
jgi:hypothetical protein